MGDGGCTACSILRACVDTVGVPHASNKTKKQKAKRGGGGAPRGASGDHEPETDEKKTESESDVTLLIAYSLLAPQTTVSLASRDTTVNALLTVSLTRYLAQRLRHGRLCGVSQRVERRDRSPRAVR